MTGLKFIFVFFLQKRSVKVILTIGIVCVKQVSDHDVPQDAQKVAKSKDVKHQSDNLVKLNKHQLLQDWVVRCLNVLTQRHFKLVVVVPSYKPFKPLHV
jgi:hypothetical protein